MTFSTLKKRTDFKRVMGQGQKSVAKGMVVYFKASEDSAQTRVGYTVTKKLGNAVVRNTIKRRFRHLARELFISNKILAGDYVIIGRYHTKDRPYDALRKDAIYSFSQFHEC